MVVANSFTPTPVFSSWWIANVKYWNAGQNKTWSQAFPGVHAVTSEIPEGDEPRDLPYRPTGNEDMLSGSRYGII